MAGRLVAAIAVVALGGGCHFGVHGVPAAPGAGADLASVDAAEPADLAALPMDFTVVDPCPAVTVPAGALAVSCARGQTIIVDGDLSEWPQALFQPIQHRNAAVASSGGWTGNEGSNDADLSGQVALRWDDQFLYVAARITDDIRGTGPSTYFEQDAVELYLDGNGDRNDAYEADDAELIFITSGAGELWRYNGVSAAALPAGVSAAAKDLTPVANWALEVAVPWSAIGGVAGASGRMLGIDIQLDDNDGGTTRDRWLQWKQAAPAGCVCPGTTTSCLPYCDPKSFATAVLGGR